MDCSIYIHCLALEAKRMTSLVGLAASPTSKSISTHRVRISELPSPGCGAMRRHYCARGGSRECLRLRRLHRAHRAAHDFGPLDCLCVNRAASAQRVGAVSKKKTTARGFRIYGEYKHTRGTVRIQQSSASGHPCVWIFSRNQNGEDATIHMGGATSHPPHLTKAQARRVAKALLEFAEEP